MVVLFLVLDGAEMIPWSTRISSSKSLPNTSRHGRTAALEDAGLLEFECAEFLAATGATIWEITGWALSDGCSCVARSAENGAENS